MPQRFLHGSFSMQLAPNQQHYNLNFRIATMNSSPIKWVDGKIENISEEDLIDDYKKSSISYFKRELAKTVDNVSDQCITEFESYFDSMIHKAKRVYQFS